MILKPKENAAQWFIYETDLGLCIEREGAYYHVSDAINTIADHWALRAILAKVPTDKPGSTS